MGNPPLFAREGVGGEFEESDYDFSFILTLSPVPCFGHWNLELGAYLEFGAWSLVLNLFLPYTVNRLPYTELILSPDHRPLAKLRYK